MATVSVNSSESGIKSFGGLRIFSKFLVAAVLFLILRGALVTSNGAGLSVPDWPTTFGENMFTYHYSKWVGGIFYEHSHRLVASGIGALTVILMLWVWIVDRRRWVRNLTLAAVGAVVAQGALGGLTVLYGLPPVISIAHGILGQTFFVITICIAYAYSREWLLSKDGTTIGGRQFVKLAWLLLVAVYLQLIFGASMRHTFSGLAVPDFPTIGGEWLPKFDASLLGRINSEREAIHLAPIGLGNVLIHTVHRVWGLVVALIALTIFIKINRASSQTDKRLVQTSWYVFLVTCSQFTLGILTIFSLRDPWVTSLHVVTGAALLGLSVLLVLRSRTLAE